MLHYREEKEEEEKKKKKKVELPWSELKATEPPKSSKMRW